MIKAGNMLARNVKNRPNNLKKHNSCQRIQPINTKLELKKKKNPARIFVEIENFRLKKGFGCG